MLLASLRFQNANLKKLLTEAMLDNAMSRGSRPLFGRDSWGIPGQSNGGSLKKALFLLGGTEGSNPAPSSGESAANLTSSPWRRHAAFTCSCNHGRERGKETPHDIASDLRLTSVPSPGRETCAGGR